MKKVWNIGIVGTGRMGTMYANLVHSRVEGAQVYAAMDIDPEALARFGESFGVERLFSTAEDMMALPELDAVLVTSTTSAHKWGVIAAARAGKPVFCEKPLGLTVADTREILAETDRAGVPLQIGFMRRFDSGYAAAKKAIEAGRIGEPIILKSISRDPFCPNPEFADPKRSGGLIIDLGIHDIDLARWLMSAEVERVSTESTLKVCLGLEKVGDDDSAVVNLRFSNGAIGNIEVSRHAFYGYDIRSEVLGSEAGLQVGLYQHTPMLLMTPEGISHDMKPYFMERFGDAYLAQIRDFMKVARGEQAPAITGADALAAIEIGVAATLSGKWGRPVTIEEIRMSEDC